MTDFQAELTLVSKLHQFDEGKLKDYLATRLPGGSSDELKIKQFQGGQSNPTFLLDSGDEKYVLRKKPPGKLLPSAHQIEREYRIMTALQGSSVPVPSTRLLCEDQDIIGTPFYVMDHVEGRIIETPDLAGIKSDERRDMYKAMIRTLANLHNINWQEIGLEGFGKAEHFYERQINRWSKQYLAAMQTTKGDKVAKKAMSLLIEWLPANIPKDVSSSISHGDYRIGNLIVHPLQPSVNAVLDWELSTIGHPLGDLAYCCIPYHLPHSKDGVKGLLGLDLEANGIPCEQDFINDYCRQVGRESIQHWNFYMAFALFRLAAILQGVFARAVQGNASSANGLKVGARASLLATSAWQATQLPTE